MRSGCALACCCRIWRNCVTGIGAPPCLAMTFSRAANGTGRGGGAWRATTVRLNAFATGFAIGRFGGVIARLARVGATCGIGATVALASAARFTRNTAARTGFAPANTLRGTAVKARGLSR